MLNQSVLEEMEKRESAIKKVSRPKVKSETVRNVEEEAKMTQEATRLSNLELVSLQGKLERLDSTDSKGLEEEYNRLKDTLTTLKGEIKAVRTKTFMLGKNLTKGPSLFETLAVETE